MRLYRPMILLVCVLFLSAFSPVLAVNYGSAEVTFHVVDESGAPVSNAKISISFSQKYSKITGRGEVKRLIGNTDKKGVYSKSEKTTGIVKFAAIKDGFYNSVGEVKMWGSNDYKFTSGRWEPWNPEIVVTMRKIENPVPMNVKRVELQYKGLNQQIGFDCERGDFIPPHGEGIVSDFVFVVSGDYIKLLDRRERLKMRFSNPGDGIREVLINPSNMSDFKLPREAFESGYQELLECSKVFEGKHRGKTGIVENQSFIFRIRTVLDEEGNVVSAKYGKIRGHIGFGFADKEIVYIMFTYYFNPDGTRNLEYDTEKNLLKLPRHLGKIMAP